jgi:DNA-binding transcriptional regulator YhcF (GntR family)
MLVRVDHAATEPLYAQIAAQVRAAIGKGRLSDGEQLPPARDLADALGVNMHTVLRAYADLRDEGLVEMRRRRGVRVRSGVDGRARLLNLVGEVATEANRQGVTKAELRRMIEEAMQ